MLMELLTRALLGLSDTQISADYAVIRAPVVGLKTTYDPDWGNHRKMTWVETKSIRNVIV